MGRDEVTKYIVPLLVLLFIHPAWAELSAESRVEKKERKKIEESVKEKLAAEEAAKRKEREKEKQVERLNQQQEFIKTHNQRIQDALTRAQFPMVLLVLPKESFKVGEAINVEFIIKNGSTKSFLVDGRKFSPTYVVKDAKGKTVLTITQEEKPVPPAVGDLVSLAPGQTFTPQKSEPFSLSKPGKYALTGSYTFLRPEEENPDVWFGTVHNSFMTRFEVVEE